MWAGFRGGELADVDKVQLWLVLLSGWAASEERAAEEEDRERKKRECENMDEMRRRQQRDWYEEVCWYEMVKDLVTAG